VFNNPRRNTTTAENELQSRMYVLSADRHGQTASPPRCAFTSCH
jgi:hypothetical protein